MNTVETSADPACSTPSVEEEILIRNLLISHDPDGRDLDSDLLLQAVKNVLHFATSSETKLDTAERSYNSQIEEVGSQKFIGDVVDKILRELFYKHHHGEDLQTRTMNLLDLLRNFRWNEKMVFILAGLAFSYGEFWLVIRLCHQNPLAGSISVLKQFPSDLKLFKPRLKALSCLIGKMMELTEHVVKFDSLPISEVKMDPELVETTKHHMYLAVYWVARSAIKGSSHIADLRAVKPKRVCRNLTAGAAWELLSLVLKLSNSCIRLQRLVEVCHRQIEEKIYKKLTGLFNETHVDNQEVLRVLFSLKDNLPFKKSLSQEKVGISKFKDKVVILYISKPELLTPEDLLFLLHQMYNNPHISKLEGSYEIIYIPILTSTSWSDSEEQNYDLVSNFLPWYLIRKPQRLSSAAMTFIKQEWNYEEEPISVVIDNKGSVINLNAIDTMKIWGSEAYPFSASREEELWKFEKSTFLLMFNGIDPLLTDRIREGRNVCIYGGDNVRWIREFQAKIEETILSKALQLEIVYVGKRTLTSLVRNILLAETQYQPSNIPISVTNIQFFWTRLDSIRRSILRQRNKANVDHILQDVSWLLEIDESATGWAMLGDGTSRDTLRLRGKEVMECLDMFPKWQGNVSKWGLVGAIRMALEPPSTPTPCGHSETIPFDESLLGKNLFCNQCKRPMKGFVTYE
ncbi:protein SIEVE ELEMENT OCCLUSION C [Punica granatum]|uniref:Protein SIEVE ELEMENT OCCLUSION C n=1 Tax=Punica granatum TaxID=22663 RepID=A0A6P8CZ86_PUNGR|nr:protein SIEVE ELEMENT OCCLUSION C [Punica granatum]